MRTFEPFRIEEDRCRNCSELKGTHGKNDKCPSSASRKPRLSRKSKDAIMESLGMVKVRGAVSGKVYYE